MHQYNNLFIILIFLYGNIACLAQTQEQEKMQKLSFMVGDWVGTSTELKNDSIMNKVPAYEKIRYKVEKHIMTIDLYSETLQLHTVIYYDKEEGNYFYQPFYKTGTASYPAELKKGKLIVKPNNDKRFIFSLTPEGKLMEYGEKRINDEWNRYFEDVLEKY